MQKSMSLKYKPSSEPPYPTNRGRQESPLQVKLFLQKPASNLNSHPEPGGGSAGRDGEAERERAG